MNKFSNVPLYTFFLIITIARILSKEASIESFD